MQGLWYQGNNLYKSKAFSKNQLIELMNGLDGRKHTRLLLKHNEYYNGDNNTPRYLFDFSNKTGDELKLIDFEEEEAIDEYFRSDTKRMFYLALDDLRSGDYSQAEATICDFLEHWNL